MENRITISICDEEYTFVAEEAPSYMQKVGSYVNDKMSELLDAAKVGRTDAADRREHHRRALQRARGRRRAAPSGQAVP